MIPFNKVPVALKLTDWSSTGTVEVQHLLSKVKLKLATLVEGDHKAPLSIATTPRCRGGRYPFPRFLHFTLNPYLIMLCAKQGDIK